MNNTIKNFIISLNVYSHCVVKTSWLADGQPVTN